MTHGSYSLGLEGVDVPNRVKWRFGARVNLNL
jgi:hypothetical protein